jgi:GTPase SAR1 family protein
MERFSNSVTPAWIRGSKVIVLVYDITKSSTFASLDDWLQFSQKVVPDAKIVLVGNKVDLEEGREVSTAQGMWN